MPCSFSESSWRVVPVNIVYELQIPNEIWGLQGLGTPHLWGEYYISANGIKYYMRILNKIDVIVLYWTSQPKNYLLF